jgi:hypothetical protein
MPMLNPGPTRLKKAEERGERANGVRQRWWRRQPTGQRRPDDGGENQLIVSYMVLRKIVGWIGTLLPVVLITGNVIFFTTSLPGSMSGYYYTHMRNVFVGALCALGIFLVAYDGDNEVDRWMTNIAGLCAIGVAFFPTSPLACAARARDCAAPSVRHLSAAQQAVGDIHLFFAAVMFIALALMALRFATPASVPGGRAKMARIRNTLYRACGFTILSCVALAATPNVLPVSVRAHWPSLFVFEALAVFAFGISWFVNGETLLSVAGA